MKKILVLLCLFLGYIVSVDAEEYTLDATTMTSSSSGTASFSNGLSITNGGARPSASKVKLITSSSVMAFSTL